MQPPVDLRCFWEVAPYNSVTEQNSTLCRPGNGTSFCPVIQLTAAASFHPFKMQINIPMLILKRIFFVLVLNIFVSKIKAMALPLPVLLLTGSRWCSNGSSGIAQCCLEGSPGGHLVQPPAGGRTMASTKAGQPWFCLARWWKLPRTEIPQSLWAACSSAALSDQ